MDKIKCRVSPLAIKLNGKARASWMLLLTRDLPVSSLTFRLRASMPSFAFSGLKSLGDKRCWNRDRTPCRNSYTLSKNPVYEICLR